MTSRAARITGWLLVGLGGAISVPTLVIAATNPPPAITVGTETGTVTSPILVTLWVVVSLAFSVVGAVIISNRPNNAIGRLFALGGVVIAVAVFVTVYAYRALAGDPGSLPAGRAAAWVNDILTLPLLGLITVFLFLLFPEGRIHTRTERKTAILAMVGISVGVLAAIVEPTVQGYDGVATPLELGTPKGFFDALAGIGWVIFMGTLIASIALLATRLRRATGRERDQLRLFAWAVFVGMILLTPTLVLPASWTGGSTSVIFVVGILGLLLVPISVGVAILRHQLLDIDLVIRRTVIVALLGVFITAVYVGVVIGVGALVGSSGNAVLSAIAAAVVALAFQPVRRWAQRLANRFVYGRRATPYEVLHEFSERVAGSYGTEDVLPRMATILGEGTGAERAQVWLKIGSELRPAAVWPSGVPGSRPASLVGADPVLSDVSLAVLVRDNDDLLGALSVTKAPSDPVTPTEEKLVTDLAHQAGLVLRNVHLVEELRASRQRLVAAQDEERRKLERNIHDGAQQQLVALQVKQRIASQLADRDPVKTKELLDQLQVEAGQALEDLRDLARGIYPPLLADAGLQAALEGQARKAALPVTVRANGTGRYPPEIEATVYFCVLEALQNAAKYSQASSVTVALAADDEALGFEVSDDGMGFDPASTARGTGLQNMTDRIDSLGGSLTVRSSPRAGTTLNGRIPIPVMGEP